MAVLCLTTRVLCGKITSVANVTVSYETLAKQSVAAASAWNACSVCLLSECVASGACLLSTINGSQCLWHYSCSESRQAHICLTLLAFLFWECTNWCPGKIIMLLIVSRSQTAFTSRVKAVWLRETMLLIHFVVMCCTRNWSTRKFDKIGVIAVWSCSLWWAWAKS